MTNTEAHILLQIAVKYAATAQTLLKYVARAGYKLRQKQDPSPKPQAEAVIDWSRDPDENLSAFLQAWRRCYGDQPQTTGEVAIHSESKLCDRVLRLLVGQIDAKYGFSSHHESGFINCGKIGMYLYKHAGKVEAGLVIERCRFKRGGKSLWHVVEVADAMDAVLQAFGARGGSMTIRLSDQKRS